PARTPLAERRDLDDAAARNAILALSTRAAPAGGGRQRIAYRDLGVEQLGAVYETLLDYEPVILTWGSAPHPGSVARGDPDAPLRSLAGAPCAPRRPEAGRTRPRARVTLERGSGLRKATGTFYTPQPIADYLVRRTLGPLIRDAAPERILELRVVDPAMGSGAFLVAACRYLAAAYESALVRSGGCHAGDLGPSERSA